MIFKSFEIEKINFDEKKFCLLYGNNEGLKKEIIHKINLKRNFPIIFYEEKEILNKIEILLNEIFNRSFFENDKIIVINNCSDKIENLVLEIIDKDINNIIIFFKSENLEKKSKLRNLFEKRKNLAIIPLYPDTNETLSKLTNNFLKINKIQMSQSNINLIVDKCNGDRIHLKNELEKIKSYTETNKIIRTEEILKLINLSENHSINELINVCLTKNKKKLLNILNENNYSTEDSILIIRTFLIKVRRILILSKIYEINNNLDATLLIAKPPVFWKEKDLVKEQLTKWNSKSLKKLIFEITDLELLVKKNIFNRNDVINDFMITKAS